VILGKAADKYVERLAMSEVTTFNWSIDQDLASYARHGFPGIEIWLNKAARNGAAYDTLPEGGLDTTSIDKLAHDLMDAGLQAVSVVCAGAFTESDTLTRKDRIAHLRFTVQFAAKIGASCVLVVPGDLHGATRSASVERTASALREGLADAHEHSIDLAIEPLRPVHTDFINTLPQALEIVTAVDDPRCGVCMDTFQVWRGDEEREQVLREIREAGPNTQIVQVADSRVQPRSKEDRLVPGEGVLPLAKMLGGLFSTGYDGWLAVEIMSTELWAINYDRLLERCRTGMEAVITKATAVHDAED
jgi:sugar phosphate isomerase/epimerase